MSHSVRSSRSRSFASDAFHWPAGRRGGPTEERPFAAHRSVDFPILLRTRLASYSRALGDGPHNFEPWSTPGPSPNVHTPLTGGRSTDLTCISLFCAAAVLGLNSRHAGNESVSLTTRLPCRRVKVLALPRCHSLENRIPVRWFNRTPVRRSATQTSRGS
ncbi:hypothetical protein TNCV_3941321 [Trichonephila clavipes]|uniref:Uncharacterized protein n=1 Tax=Trichonephila clavipes TaxID=2585209 RepID=A0A8X6VVY9_TRICX|nr:hypothetical protein TNCV_3941321 [Trichonephila clavipes]